MINIFNSFLSTDEGVMSGKEKLLLINLYKCYFEDFQSSLNWYLVFFVLYLQPF